MITKRWMLVFTSLALALLLAACGGKSTPAPTATPVPPSATPVPPTPVPPTPTPVPPTATPVPPTPEESHGLEIIQQRNYVDNVDSLYITGLIQNNTDQTVDALELSLAISDSNGSLVYTDTQYALMDALLPGEITPFAFNVYDDLSDVGDVLVTVSDYDVESVDRVKVDITGSKMFFDSSGDVYITGIAVNNNDKPVDLNEIAAAVFDADGNILIANTPSADVSYLDPGESGPFIVYLSGPADGTDVIKEYKLYIDAVVGSEDSYDIEFVGDETVYRDTYDSFHLVGEVANHSNKNLNIRLVAAFYDADDNVLDVDSLDLPISSLAPEEKCPYDFNFWNLVNYDEDIAQQIDHYTVQWDPGWTWTASTQVKLSTTEEASFDSGTATFSGQIVNDSDYDLSSAEVVVLLRDKTGGNVVATGDAFSLDEIPAGGSADYSVEIELPTDFNKDSVTYEVIARGSPQ